MLTKLEKINFKQVVRDGSKMFHIFEIGNSRNQNRMNNNLGAPTKLGLPLGCLNGQALQAVDSGVEISRQMSISRLEVIFRNCWSPKEFAYLRYFCWLFTKKGETRGHLCWEKSCFRITFSWEIESFLAVGKRCYMSFPSK